MIAPLTTTVTIDAPTASADAYGDPLDVWPPASGAHAAEGVGATFIEDRPGKGDPKDSRLTETTQRVMTVPHGTAGLVEGNRVTDERTGQRWIIHHVHEPAHFAYPEAPRVKVRAYQ